MSDHYLMIVPIREGLRLVQAAWGPQLWYVQARLPSKRPGEGGWTSECMHRRSEAMFKSRGRPTALEAMAAYDGTWKP